MVEAKAKRARGRPKGSRNKVAKPAAEPLASHRVTPAEIEEVIEEWSSRDAAGNGRDEPAYETASTPFSEAVKQGWRPEPEVQEALQAADELVQPAPARAHFQGSEGMWTAERPPEAKPKVVLPDLFIHRVENGYLIRPAYSQGDHRTSTDVRTWVVSTKEALAALIVELIAEPVVHATPQRQSQDYYSPPLIVETGVGPVR